MSGHRRSLATTVALVCIAFAAVAAAPASAADPYEFDPTFSLTGDCSVSGFDPVPDPGCPSAGAPPVTEGGRFKSPSSITVDSYGNEYVASYGTTGAEGRIDVYDDEGHFLTELDDPHGPKSIAVDSDGNLYAYEKVASAGENAVVVLYPPVDYEPLVGNIEYDASERIIVDTSDTPNAGGLAIDSSNGHLFVTYWGTEINEFGPAKAGGEANDLLNTITHPDLHSNQWVAVDAKRKRLYASSCNNGIFECVVLVLEAEAPYALLEEVDGSETPEGEFKSQKGWTSIAVDEESGHFFVDDLELRKFVYEFDQNYKYVSTIQSNGFQGGNTLQIGVSNSALNPAAKNLHYLFVPNVNTAGRAVAFHPPGLGEPSIESLEAAAIGETEAELRATVESNGGNTQFVFEYEPREQFEEEGGFGAPVIAAEGTIPGESQPRNVIAAVSGLSPGVAYQFRIRVSNDAGEDEAESAFTTYSDAVIGGGACPNEVLRMGPSALLPDCRAYELVTPADTNGRPPKGVGFVGDRFATLEASPSGGAVSFVTEGGALPGTEGTGSFNGDLYRASRGSTGWGTVLTGPTGTEANVSNPGSTSPDQGFAFWTVRGEGSAVLVPDPNKTHYVRYPDGRAELVGRGKLATDPTALGWLITEGGSHIVFQTTNEEETAPQLESNAPPTGTGAVYDRTSDEVTHVVSLLPGDETPEPGENAAYLASSADGEGIAFLLDVPLSLVDTMYVRVNNAETFEIGPHEVGTKPTLAGISEGGRRVFYVEGGDLFALDTDTEERINFTGTGDATVVNVSPDGSRAYFVSPSVIAGVEENPRGAVPVVGQQNLYLSEEGDAFKFVGVVTTRDVQGELNPSSNTRVDGLGLWVEAQPSEIAKDPSRLTPAGTVLLFQSRANLTGEETEGLPQVYRYDSTGNELDCISCIPTGIPVGDGSSLQSSAPVQDQFQAPFSVAGYVPNLRADGKRAFFQSDEALVSSDSNGAQDVYQWEEQGVGSCTKPGGCVYLISSGHSARDNYLYGLSRSGDDVFFITEDILVGGDSSTASIYDARVNGGFPEPSEDVCIGEGCHPSMTPAPILPAPARPAEGADDNVKPKKCPKGKRKVKRKGKVRCVKKHKNQKHRPSGGKKGGSK